MTEQQRADMLARAVDHLIHPNRNPPPPQSRTDRDLDTLVHVAASRAQAGSASRLAAASSRDGVWRRVAERLDTQVESNVPAVTLPGADAAELAGVIAARRDLSEHVLEYARSQQQAVWVAVSARLKAAAIPSEAGSPRGNPPGSRTEARAVHDHQALVTETPGPLANSGGNQQSRAWRGRRKTRRDRGTAGIIAATALFVAAIGPLPATGLANHPAAMAVDEVRSHLGVAETATAPPDPPAAEDGLALDVSLDEARGLTNLPVLAPGAPPEGFTLATSRYYATAPTADLGGVFVLSYVDANGIASIDIFQESDSGADVAAPTGVPVDIEVAGLRATYMSGAWSATSGTLVWEPGGTQRIVFETDGVRTTIRYTGPAVSPQVLVELAADLAGQLTG